MLFATPEIDSGLTTKLATLDELRGRLGAATGVAGPWLGQLRRRVRASTVASSVSIEGFTVSSEQARLLTAGDIGPSSDDADQLAVVSYARAMDHVGTMAVDPAFRWSDRVILDLHFDACLFQRDRSPGLWRTGPIGVTGPGGRGVAYEAPPAADVVVLMDEVVAWLESGGADAHVVVRAAMAHLHVVAVHPFRDGNGRIARIVQSLVLARGGLLAPEFNSIEEYLGHHTAEYYAALREAGGATYQPGRDVTAWVSFCIDAHIEQARERLALIEEASARWSRLERLAEQRGWPDRLVTALQSALLDGVDRAAYAREVEVSLPTASNDLRRLVDAGLVEQRGRTRSTRYVATDALRDAVR